MDIKEGFESWENALIIVSGLALIIAAFLTWATASLSAELTALAPTYSNLGAASGIKMSFGYASAACGLLAIAIFYFKKSKVFTIILGFIAFLIGGLIWIYNTKVIPSKTVDVVMQNGMGLYLTMIAAIGLIVGGFLIKKK